jgi:hypothetical protein
MAWHPIFRLGPAGGELDFVCRVMGITVDEGNIEAEERNLAGATLKSYLRVNVPRINLTVAMLTDAAVAALRGLQSSLSPLNFVYNKSLAAKYLQATSQTTTSIIIPPTPATGIVISGVYLASDYAQSGTNYYSGGSTFDSATGEIVLATPLPDLNTDVTVNYTYNGISCFLRVSLSPHSGYYSGYWQGTLTLTGA